MLRHCHQGWNEHLVYCRGALPSLTDRLRALSFFSAKNISAANGRYRLNSVGDPLPEIFMFQRWGPPYCTIRLLQHWGLTDA